MKAKITIDKATMFKEDGMWMIKTGKPLTVEDVNAAIESVREERHRQFGPEVEKILRTP